MADQTSPDPASPPPAGATDTKPAKRRRRRRRAGPARWLARVLAAPLIYTCVIALAMPEVARDWRWPTMIEIAALFERPPEPPPQLWYANARDADVLAVPHVNVAYWGRPDAPYGDRVTRTAKTPVAVIVHFTDQTPAVTLVEYGHRPDPARGNSAFGYHFYIDASGRVLQGAPLSVRTNHIKPAHAVERIAETRHLDGANTIGVSLIGACRSPRLSPITYRCTSETPTAAQLESGLAIIAALQQRYGMPCAAVYGHGELQSDRHAFEGTTLSARARKRC